MLETRIWRLKLWKVVHIGFGLLQQQRSYFCDVGAVAPNSPTLNQRLQYSDFLSEPRKCHCRQRKTLYADITLPWALKWSRKTVVFHTHIGSTDCFLQCSLRIRNIATDFMVHSVWMGIIESYRELSAQLLPLCLDALFYLIYPFRHISAL